ncbi:MAG: S1 family peptidase [Allosphingosinicella sp.]|uniref:S1 family peptidase n=1 Tax=Allosphingosinicella sp. TaxID=2823234 RepID=UPI003946C8C2
MLKRSFLMMVATATLSSAGIVVAQQPTRVPPLPTAENSRGPGRDLQVEFLAQKYGISPQDAAERASILRDIQEVVRAAVGSDEAAFAGVWVDHVPAFKIIVGFAGESERREFLDQLSPRLRRYVQIRHTVKALAVAQREVSAIHQALSVAGTPFETYFEPRSQNHIVVVPDQRAANTVRGLIPPALRSSVNIRVGPVLTTHQTNVRSGDAVYGAWELVNSNGDPTCTYGFAGRDSSGRDSILTAGHCQTNPPYVVGADANHLVQLPAATETRYGDQYDFRHHAVVGLATGYWVWFDNGKPVHNYSQYVNTVPGFGADGYFTVQGRLQYTAWNSNHYVGMPVCKSGFASGFTCGTVEANWVSGIDVRGVSYTGFVRVSGSTQQVIAFGGDSGAPVFSFPSSAYEVTAYGLLKGGATAASGGPCTGAACYFAYMPIDRVNDRVPFLLHTTQGMLAP